MNFWINFWTIFFFASIILFAVVVIVVSIGGFFNIRSLLKDLTNRLNQPPCFLRKKERGENSYKDDE